MSPSRKAAGRRYAARAAIAQAAAAACLTAVVAYAATRPGDEQRGLGEKQAVQQPAAAAPGGQEGAQSPQPAPPARERLPRTRLIEAPPEATTVSDPQFRFHGASRRPPAPTPAPPSGAEPPPAEASTRRFQCRVDGDEWGECRSPYKLSGLVPGSHHFAVRAFSREGRPGEATGYDWRQTTAETAAAAPAPNEVVAPAPEPKQFTVLALREPEDLYPGLAPTPIPVRVGNPNDVAIEVTAIDVAIGAAPADCPAENFELTPAGASAQEPLLVPAESSVDLPAAGLEAPAIQMLDLPIEQDACRGAEIPLVFSGEARG